MGVNFIKSFGISYSMSPGVLDFLFGSVIGVNRMNPLGRSYSGSASQLIARFLPLIVVGVNRIKSFGNSNSMERSSSSLWSLSTVSCGGLFVVDIGVNLMKSLGNSN